MTLDQFLEYSGLGFRQLRPQALHALAPHDYERMFDDPAEWDRLQCQMQKYFDDKTDMFAYYLQEPSQTDDETGASSTATKREPRFFFRVRRPNRYFEIEEQLVKRRFPGGLGSTPGDEDLRLLVSALRHLFAHNLVRYILYKRLCAFAFSIFAIVVLAVFARGLISTAGFAASELGLIGLFLAINDWIIFKYYISALNESCYFVNNEASRRSKNLSNLFDTLLPKIDTEREKLQYERRLHDWPERSARWMTLIYWVAKRLEYVERHVQAEIWRMRRLHYWLNRGGFALMIMALAVSLTLGWTYWIYAVHTSRASVTIAFAVTQLLIIANAFASFLFWNAPIDLVEDKLQPNNWNRYRDIRMHKKISDQIFRDKQKIIDLDWTAGGGRGTPVNPVQRVAV